MAVLTMAGLGFAQEQAAEPTAPKAEQLSSKQEALTLRYQRFETTLLQLAEYLRKTDPDRADLLVRALGRSKETRIPDQLTQLVELLKRDQLGDAIDGQEALVTQMQDLLTLLQSEDRQSDIDKERSRIAGLIKNIDKLIGRQTDVRSATERGLPGKEAQSQQQKVAEETHKLIDKIKEQDAEKTREQDKTNKPDRSDSRSDADDPKSDQSPSEESSQPNPPSDNGAPPSGKPPSGKQGEPKPPAKTDDSSDPQKPQDADESPDKTPQEKQSEKSAPSPKTPGSQPPSQSGKPQKSQPSPSQPMPQQGDSPSPQDSPQDSQEDQQPPAQQHESPRELPHTPGRQELEQAHREMEKAIEELKRQQRDKASSEQDQALAELLKAKEKLEEILRQLREEEKELMLAAMEARFRDMLGRQIAVHNGTVGLGAVPENQRSDRHRSRAIDLARDQDEVGLLAAKALTLLKEEGSSIAFPEAVEQIRTDMLTTARRLERVDVGEITQGIQRDIIESLEEILDALQKELEKSKDQRRQQQQAQQGRPQQPGLVDGLAELKMLRSLQYRVNRRTRELGRLIEGEQTRDPDVASQLQELSRRQAKIQQTAADLASGRNQ